ncbi:ABC transporter ATP-binding protein, partial [Phenylobacterium sp.]|uniref:ABC transporter ATP-binding protein n=1 Tax=Phenylobacterium sp. TaxID=1871053 RepID=UPI002E354B70
MSEELFDEDEGPRKRVLSNSQVLAFVASLWLRRPVLLAAAIGLLLVAIGFDLALPWAAGQLVDAVAAGPSNADAAWQGWALFVGVYVCFSVVRNIAFRFWNPLAARNMKELTDEAFRKVQSFSADWHADNFAGATVRKLTRAMWGYDQVSDAVVIWLGPAFCVLVGLSVMMMLRWPAVGLFSLISVALYVGATLALNKYYTRPANLKSVALDSKIGGALADSVSSNPTVKAFGAERREEARLALVTEEWRVATLRTWNRFMDTWLVQNLVLVMLQAGLTGLLVRQWARGEAKPGDVAFAITSFMLMSGYLRNIGEN